MKKLTNNNSQSNVITLKGEHQQLNLDKTRLHLLNNLLVNDAKKLPSEVSNKLHEKIVNSLNESSHIQAKSNLWPYAIAVSLFSFSLFNLIYEPQSASPIIIGKETPSSDISLDQERIALINDINKLKKKLMM